MRRADIDSFGVSGGGVVLWDRGAGRLLLYNPSAAFIWHGLAGGLSRDALVQAFGRQFSVSRKTSANDVERLQAHFAGEGLLGGRPDSKARNRQADTSLASSVPAKRQRIIEIGLCGRTIRVCLDPEIAPRVDLLLSNLKPAAGRACETVSLTGSNGQYAVWVGSAVRLRSTRLDEAVGGLYQSLLRLAYPDTRWTAFLHGSAVARDGRAIILAGPSGSGKSTLAANLALGGYTLLSDDLVAMRGPRGDIVPWPLPISLKTGSWHLFPDLHAGSNGSTTVSERYLGPSQVRWSTVPVAPAALIFPTFSIGAPAELSAISPFDALERLMSDRIHLGFPLTKRRIARFLAWVEDMPAFRLTYGSNDAALECLREGSN